MAKYTERVQSLISEKDKKLLKKITDQDKNINTRVIIEKFIKTYCSTHPTGLEIQKEEINEEIEDIDKKIDLLIYKKEKLQIKLKVIDDSLKDKTIFDYSPEIEKAIDNVFLIANQKEKVITELEEEIFILNAERCDLEVKEFKELVFKKNKQK